MGKREWGWAVDGTGQPDREYKKGRWRARVHTVNRCGKSRKGEPVRYKGIVPLLSASLWKFGKLVEKLEKLIFLNINFQFLLDFTPYRVYNMDR